MKAILPERGLSNARNYSGKKELISVYDLVAYKDGKLHHLMTIRSWMGRSKTASTVYSSIWVHAQGYWTSGTGTAGGWGYHKTSAAAGYAIRSAGITLDEIIDGRGDQAIREAMEAIALALGFDNTIVVEN